jgi:predicted nicotinamide N-methyase
VRSSAERAGSCATLTPPAARRRSDEERFDRPYEYEYDVQTTLRIEQRRFGPEARRLACVRFAPLWLTLTLQGFASTVWDSSIVLSKYIERRYGTGAGALAGRRVVELGSGCGLVSCVLARLGADVTATDMEGNLPLLRDNLAANRARPRHAWTHAAPSDSFPACSAA